MKLDKALLRLAIMAISLALASAECPNACSGHGVCGAHDMCTCERNWQGSDCSLRTCPFGTSHVDIPKGDLDASGGITDHDTIAVTGSTIYPYGTTEGYPQMIDTSSIVKQNTAHYYAECSNKGLCDRKSGQCECLPGYDGSSCQRASCPSKSIQRKETEVKLDTSGMFINQRDTNTNSGSVFTGSFVTSVQVDTCSGHGTCKTIEDLATDEYNNKYELWDKESSMACACDPGYGAADCSERLCPYGIDPLWTDDTTARVTQTAVRFETTVGSTLQGKYALRFFDVFGEDYITQSMDLSDDGTGVCAEAKVALEGLPDNVIPEVNCNLSALSGNTGFEYVLTFIRNPGKLRQLEIIENTDGTRPTVEVTSGSYTASVYTKVNGEFVDHFADKCEGVTLKVIVDSADSDDSWNAGVRPGSIGYLDFEDGTGEEAKLFKACLGDSDGDMSNNVDVANWDEASLWEAEDGGGAGKEFKMIGSFPHAVKVVQKEDEPGYNMHSYGEYYLVWYDSTASAGKEFRVANVNNNANQLLEAMESYVFTTKGRVRQLGHSSGTELRDNRDATQSTNRIVGYFDAYSNKVYTNFDTSCENHPPSTGDANHQCIEKGDKLFIIDSCWGKGNSGAAIPVSSGPFFGGSEVSCANSNAVNHDTGNIYTVTKVYKQPLLSALSTDDPTDSSDLTSAEAKKYVDTFVIEVDGNLGWEGQKGDPENTDTGPYGASTPTWSDNTGIVTLFHFVPDQGSDYEYVSQCSNRGLCEKDSGLCTCFGGYTGVDCSIQNALYGGS